MNPKTLHRVAIVGAGIAGRLCAWALRRAGFDIEIFDKSARYSDASCSFAAAGLLTPLAEIANGDPGLSSLGMESLKFWRNLAADFNDKDLINLNGSVTLSYAAEPSELLEFERKLRAKNIDFERNPELREPSLDSKHLTYHIIPGEGCVDTARFMHALLESIEHEGVRTHFLTAVDPNELSPYDIVIDTRGASGHDYKSIRGVRGESMLLHAPEVNISRPTRVLHARYPAYIVPRADHHYIIGATTIESENTSPITVKSILDLIHGIYNIHPGFRYAAIVKTFAALRPAFDDNLPYIHVDKRRSNQLRLSLNGLYRHGYLLGPLFADAVRQIACSEEIHPIVQKHVIYAGEER